MLSPHIFVSYCRNPYIGFAKQNRRSVPVIISLIEKAARIGRNGFFKNGFFVSTESKGGTKTPDASVDLGLVMLQARVKHEAAASLLLLCEHLCEIMRI